VLNVAGQTSFILVREDPPSNPFVEPLEDLGSVQENNV
jgi:hypothetical protein